MAREKSPKKPPRYELDRFPSRDVLISKIETRRHLMAKERQMSKVAARSFLAGLARSATSKP